MKWLNRMTKWGGGLVKPSTLYVGGALLVLLMGIETASAEPKWPSAPYTYFANRESLQDVLQKFASGFSLSLHLNSGVHGLVNGKFTAENPTEFIDKLGGVYGFNWFVYAGTLFVSPTQAMVTKAVNVTSGSVSGLKEALKRLGVLDNRFGWGELNDQGLALISGPPDYVKLIEKTIKALPLTSGNQEVAVFRLKYASVSDRVVQYRDKSVTTPGVETILRNLIEGTGSKNGGNDALASMAAPLRNAMPFFPGYSSGLAPLTPLTDISGNNNNSSVKAEVNGHRKSSARVQADVRLNAIIVQDIPERIPIYRALIAQLDVPSTLIEIEAMIVDVKKTAMKKLGVQWGANASINGRGLQFGFGGLGANTDTSVVSPITSDGTTNPLNGQIAVGVGNILIARIDALQSDNLANVLIRPSILTTDNMGSIIDASQKIYLNNQSQYYASTSSVEIGTLLNVTPRYIQGKQGPEVELTVDIRNGTVAPIPEVVNKGDAKLTTEETKISTLATVGAGQALLIGGINGNSDSDVKSKVPLLGDIPIIGSLFASKQRELNNYERLILIRPRIVAINGVPLVPMSLGKWGDIVDLTWGEQGSRSEELNTAKGVIHYVHSAQTLYALTPGHTRVYHAQVDNVDDIAPPSEPSLVDAPRVVQLNAPSSPPSSSSQPQKAVASPLPGVRSNVVPSLSSPPLIQSEPAALPAPTAVQSTSNPSPASPPTQSESLSSVSPSVASSTLPNVQPPATSPTVPVSSHQLGDALHVSWNGSGNSAKLRLAVKDAHRRGRRGVQALRFQESKPTQVVHLGTGLSPKLGS